MFSARILIAVAAVAGAAAPAGAVSIAVANASFESLPPGGLGSGCGTGCSFSFGPIPGWSSTGNATGQFQPGSSAGNFSYFNYVPDGITVAYTNDGTITQTVGATAVAGTTYTLTTAFGVRNDIGNPGSIRLIVAGNTVFATGTLPASGTWSTYTASYTATAADAGGAIDIVLASAAGQGDFDAVTLDAVAGVPEPATWGLLLTGFAGVGIAARRRRTALAA